MSYKKRKVNKNKFNRLRYKVGLVKIALKRAWLKVAKIGRKEKKMLPVVGKVMENLRAIARSVRANNLKINEWVDEYVNQCVLKGTPVEILTQWCLSKDLETRYRAQGGQFIPLTSEKEVFEKEIPRVLRAFLQNKMSVNWVITLNGSFLERGRVAEQLVAEYIKMLNQLLEQNEVASQNVVLFDWEKDILGTRPQPNQEVLNNFDSLVSQQAFEIDFANLMERVKKYPDLKKTEAELRKEAKLKIAFEAEEGRLLASSESPTGNGEFILVPLEFPERYVFFSTLAPNFSKRVAAVLKPYPWRMDANSLNYDL